uniref:Nuclear pore complex protein Nup85 n=1 Tax=Spongospora subterranea TaxID=70186 RepID=A0A0H5RQ92_9EUKA|eukprot:CRZ10874.1 hypothetical protein [Spongospora subterranea]
MATIAQFGSSVHLALANHEGVLVDVIEPHDLHQITCLLHVWHPIFESLHRFRRGDKKIMSRELQDALTESSCRYIAEMGAFRDLCNNSQVQSRIRVCESLWMLAHVVFILPHESIARQMLNWFHFHNLPFKTAPLGSLWHRVHTYILYGYISDAISIIVEEAAPEFDPIASQLVSLLQSLPLLDRENQCLTALQFDEVFNLFRHKCTQFANQQSVRSSPELSMIAKSLSGDVASIIESSKRCSSGNWVVSVIALLLLSSPNANKADLADIVTACCEENEDYSKRVSYHDAIYSIMIHDIPCALMALRSQLGASWLAAHLADVLQIGGQSMQDLPTNKQCLRATLVFEYGSALISDSNLWELAPAYLITCHATGRELIIPSIYRHVTDEFMAEKAIDLCNRLQAPDHANSVALQMSAKSLAMSCPGNAFLWSLRGNHPIAANAIINKVIQDWVGTGFISLSLYQLQEMIAACPDPSSSLLSLCAAVHVVSIEDPIQKLSRAVVFLHRGDIYNSNLDTFIALQAAQIITASDGAAAITANLVPQDISTILRVLSLDSQQNNLSDQERVQMSHGLIIALSQVILKAN